MEAPTPKKKGPHGGQEQVREAVNRIITITAGLPVAEARRFIGGILRMDDREKERLHELHDSLRSVTRKLETLGGESRH
jgi:Ni,Fe-hydrogenase III large subunit